MFFGLVLSDSYHLVADIIKFRKRTLGRKEALDSMKSETKHSKPSKFKECCLVKATFSLVSKLARYFGGTDTTFWFAKSVGKEVFEIVIQTQAMILYNGGADHSELAQRPNYIKLFSTVLCLNCISCSVMWILYAVKTDFCFGVVFEIVLIIFFLTVAHWVSSGPSAKVPKSTKIDQNLVSGLGQRRRAAALSLLRAAETGQCGGTGAD